MSSRCVPRGRASTISRRSSMANESRAVLARKLLEATKSIQGHVDREWGIADTSQYIDLSLLDIFLDTPENAAALCDSTCAVCFDSKQAILAERLQRCRQARCSLRDGRVLEAERNFIAVALTTVWRKDPHQYEMIEELNKSISAWGAGTAGLRIAEDGTLRRMFFSATLRGRVHVALINIIASIGGDPGDTPAARGLSTGQARKLASEKRQADERLQGFFGDFLESQGESLTSIAKQFGVKDTETMRKRINAYRDWRMAHETDRKSATFRH